MISPVTASNASRVNTLSPESLDLRDSPRVICAPESEFAPPGCVFEDSFRGTLFWESKHTDSEIEIDQKMPGEAQVEKHFGGRPFEVVWLSTGRVPFCRTRGLRNVWNGNKEVKVARDGTELESSIGNRLIKLFHE
jgi:hypothetical protein